jgi:hypothetical protein
MGPRRLQIAPRFQNDELVFEVDALENIGALIAGLPCGLQQPPP